jgi:hypothetical protein
MKKEFRKKNEVLTYGGRPKVVGPKPFYYEDHTVKLIRVIESVTGARLKFSRGRGDGTMCGPEVAVLLGALRLQLPVSMPKLREVETVVRKDRRAKKKQKKKKVCNAL